MKKKVMLVFGTRPEAIKMAPLVKEFQRHRSEFTTCVCVTAQHRQMLDEVLKIFAITPDYDLNIMQEGQTLFHITSAALCRMEAVLKEEKPDLVLVHGDTTTTFAAALAAFYQHIPVGHVEAGLRSYDRTQPFPEEANRLLTDALCDLYFAPTSTSKKALLKENIDPAKIFVTGNTVIDALRMVLAQKRSLAHPVLKKIAGSLTKKRVILVTAHRRENFGKPLEEAFTALARVARKYPDVQIVYPVHLNPKVQEPAYRILGGQDNILLLPPLNYADLAHLMDLACLVVTDSGGLQEEAPSLGKPVLVLREVTERPEAVKAGTVRIVGTHEKTVFSRICQVLDDRTLYHRMAKAVNPYGDGKAAQRTVDAVRYYFGSARRRPNEFKV
jgi:UDP-N-acetylglucosamine 2-epimerase (non-hydrolysing)